MPSDPSDNATGPPAVESAGRRGHGHRAWAPWIISRRERWRAHWRNRSRQDLLFLGIVAAWLALDQITKVIVRETLAEGSRREVTSFFSFSHVSNEGAAFGLFSGANELLAVSAVVAIGVLALYYFSTTCDHWLPRSGLALIMGGALGNLLDRLYQGRVTDFIDFSHFPAFNVADTGINIGVAAILIYMLISYASPHVRRQ